MKTLYERLSKENQSKIENYEYEALKANAISALKNNNFFNQLRLGDVTIIYGCIYDDVFNLYKFYELFNINYELL